MAADTFLAALERITAGTLTLAELISAATALRDDGQAASAEQLYRVWIGFNAEHPHLYAAYFNLSTLLRGPEGEPAAIAALEKAVASKPDFWPAYINLGGALERSGDANSAIARWKTVTEGLDQVTGPNVALKLTALKQISRVLIDHQQAEAAEAHLQLCLEINPEQRDALEQYVGLRLQQCRWPVLEPWDGASRETLMGGVSPLSMAAFSDDPLLQLAAAARYVELVTGDVAAEHATDRRDAPIEDNRRLRVGYVSSDLRDHAVGYLMAEVFELHDRAAIETFAYYCGPPATGALNERFKASAEHWRDLTNQSDEEAAATIAADGIDILVDINGHTRFGRIGLFARRPAPIIVNWLGYPGTAGSPFHHYLIADPWLIPLEAELYYSEKVLRLPCYQPNDRKRVVAAERPTRADAGLPDDAFVFCCFNGSQKISRFAFERWLEILRRAPGSVLWLLESDAATNARLADYAAERGIDAGRIIFAPKQPNAEHLARYPLADLFLDTAPYGAHTTASDALWMGVPVLTLAGRSFASRVCSSLVSSAGLEGLIVSTPEAYIERAGALAANAAEIAAYKLRLAATRDSCRLFDMDTLVACLEDLYREMASDYRHGALPRPDLTNLDAYFRAGLEHNPDTEDMVLTDDYHGLWRERLAHRHRARQLMADRRLWTQDEIARLEPPVASESVPRVRLVSDNG